MVSFPIDKYLSQDYRDTLRTFDAPQNIDTDSPLIPVIDIQKGYIKPNSKQKLRTYLFFQGAGAAARTVQIASNSTTRQYYFLAAKSYKAGTVNNSNISLIDATTGGATYADGETDLLIREQWLAAAPGVREGINIGSAPIKTDRGIRLDCVLTGAGEEIWMLIYYIEEILQ